MTNTLGSVIVTEAQALLNDTAGQLYTSAVLLPYIKHAIRELQAECLANSIQLLETTATEQQVVAGNLVLPSPPTDMVVPERVFERAWGSTNIEDYEVMTRQGWLPEQKQDTKLRYWAFQGDSIGFLGATTDRGVKLEYIKFITNIGAATDPIPTNKAENFITDRTAGLAARFIGENESRADYLDGMAQLEIDHFLTICVKDKQSLPARRIPYTQRFRRYIR